MRNTTNGSWQVIQRIVIYSQKGMSFNSRWMNYSHMQPADLWNTTSGEEMRVPKDCTHTPILAKLLKAGKTRGKFKAKYLTTGYNIFVLLWFCLSKGIHEEHKTQDLGYFWEKWSKWLHMQCSWKHFHPRMGW